MTDFHFLQNCGFRHIASTLRRIPLDNTLLIFLTRINLGQGRGWGHCNDFWHQLPKVGPNFTGEGHGHSQDSRPLSQRCNCRGPQVTLTSDQLSINLRVPSNLYPLRFKESKEQFKELNHCIFYLKYYLSKRTQIIKRGLGGSMLQSSIVLSLWSQVTSPSSHVNRILDNRTTPTGEAHSSFGVQNFMGISLHS